MENIVRFCFLLLAIISSQFVYSQADDIMIVEYVDWNSGSGVGVKIYNPTNATINLSAYTLNVYNNGNTTPSGSYSLSGTIAAGATKILGNTPYCNTNCSSTCDLTNSSGGVNENDCVAILKSGNFIDMVGLWGYDPGNAGWTVGGVSNAHYQKKMTRNGTNCIRYTATDGTSANSWPNSTSTNHPGWTVSTVACLSQGYSPNFSGTTPKINIPSKDTTVCRGASITFTGAGSYRWLRNNGSGKTQINANATSINITFNQDGNDTVFAETNTCGITIYDTVIVNVGTPIALNLGKDSTFCGAVNLQLNPNISGSPSYLWQDNSTAATFQASAAGTYHVLVTRNNCTARDTIVLTSQSTSPPSLGNDTAICAGDSLLKSYTCPGCTYLWSNNVNTPSIYLKTAGTYWIEVDNGTCKVRDTIVLTTNAKPTVNIGPDSSACAGDSITLLSPTGMDSYVWSDASTATSLTAKTSGQYWLRVTKNNCSNSDTANLTFNAKPIVNLGNDTVRCVGDSIVLTAPAGNSAYLWSTAATSNSILVKTSSNYHVQVTQNNCKNADTISVIFSPIPVVNLGKDSAICADKNIVLSGPAGMNAYLWNTGATTQNISVNTAGNYWLAAAQAGCSNADTVVITVNPVPQFSLGTDTTICQGDSYTLDAAGQPGLIWSNGSTTPTILVNLPGVYWARATANNCSFTDTVLVSVTNFPTNILNDTVYCDSLTVLLDATTIGATGYLWDDGSTQPQLLVDTAGVYGVVVSFNNCMAKDSSEVTLLYAPQSPLLNDTEACEGSIITINATVPNGTNYLWSNGDTTPILQLNDTGGVYAVTINNACGTVSETLTVTLEDCDLPFIPNVFTPNGDGLNDFFTIGYRNATDFSIEIYNRWGEMVFKSDNPQFAWDGTFRGELVPMGAYFYVIVSKNGNNKIRNTKGSLTILR